MKKTRNTTPLRTALIYAFFSSLWILLSDKILNLFIPHISPDYVVMQTIKGWSFVLVSAGLIYIFLLRELKSLRESEERFSKIFHASPFAMNLFSLSDNTSTLANDAFLNLIGYSRDELVGHTAAELNLFVDPAIRFVWMKELSETGSTKPQNIQMRKKSGEIRDVSASIECIDVSRRKMGLVMAMDITARKQAEDQLRESEYSLKRSQAVAHVGDWSWDTQSNQVTWSDEMHRIFGINPEAFNGDLNDIIAKAIHPDDREKVAHSNESVINEQAPAPLEYRVVWPDESVHTVLAIPGERFTDEKGNILRLTGVVQDITERKRAEERLHLQNERFLHFTNSNIVGIVIAEAGGKIVLANDYYLKLLDVNRQDFMDGKVDWRKFTPSEWLPADEKAISELYERGVCEPYEKEYVRADGTRVSVYIADAMLPGPEEQIAAFVLDITARKQAEKQIVQMKRLYATLSQVNQTIVRVKDRDDLYQSICDVAAKFGEFTLAWVGLLDEASGEVQPVAAVGQDINHWPFAAINIHTGQSRDGLIVEAIRNSKVVTSEDIGNDERIKPQTELFQKYGYHSTAVIPFRLKGKTIGVVSLVSGIKGFFKSEDEIRLLDEMGLDISFALDTMETEAERKEAEARLRNSQNLLQDIIDHTPSLIYALDTDGRFILANQKLETLFGLTDRQVIGKTRADILPLENANEHRKNDVQVINSRQASLFEEENQEADGKHFYLTLKFPLIDADDKVYAVCGISTDITEHKQAEEKLRESEERYRQLLDVSPVGVAVHSGGRLVFTNPAGAKLVGAKEPGDIIGKPITEIIHPDNLQDASQRIQRMLAGEKGLYPVEDRYLRLDGSEVPVEVMAVPLNYEGKPAVQVIIQDITERKRAEEQLHLQTAILEASANAIVITNREGIIQWANPAFTTLTGFEVMEDALGKNPRDLVRSGLQEKNFYRMLWDTILAGKVWRGELVNRRKDGTIYDEEMTITPFANMNGVITNFIAVKQEITERKLAEKQIQIQLRRMSALSEIDRAISSSMDLRLSLDTLLTQVLSQLNVDAASILLLNSSSQTLEYFTGKGFRTLNIHQSRTRLGEGLAGRAGLERKLFHIPDLAELDSQFHRREFLKGEDFVEYFGVPLIAKGMLKGVLEIFHRSHLNPDLGWLDYLETLGGQAAIAIDNIQLFEGTQKSNLELISAYDATIEGWSRAMDLRDKETEGHTVRVTELTVQLAIKLGIGQQEIVQMRRGALLHDIGKLGVPDQILFKPGELTDFEWAIMRQHPRFAYNMLLPIIYLRPALDIPYCHHEKWDGTGYPRGLREEQIPLSARIFAIVDVWDALRSDRPYRASWTIEKTREHIIEGSGAHFDPQVVEAFLSLLDEFPDLR